LFIANQRDKKIMVDHSKYGREGYKTERPHVPEDTNPIFHSRENFKVSQIAIGWA
jgi:hypothetical protein